MFRAALVGAAITFGLIVIPVLHFITGLPAPLIGGYMAGARTACSQGQALLLGLLMALLLAAPVMGILLALARFDLVSGGLALALWGGLLGWFFAGGVVGSALGGASARRSAAEAG